MAGLKYIETLNAQSLLLSEIPVLDYSDFFDVVVNLMQPECNHVVVYYVVDYGKMLKYFCCIADDDNRNLKILSHEQLKPAQELKSLTAILPQFHIFEREIHENFGVCFNGHPWLKPVRWPNGRYSEKETMNSYPFYSVNSEELHEVGVGPIHAGIIEPGHFRFICNGEKVLHLEIHLGYQHRGVEKLFLQNTTGLQNCILSESIAGDTAVANSLVHAQLIESLCNIKIPEILQIERCIALELERIAVHIGDTAALCTDVAYQLGQVVNEALRTTIINTTQFWCGNRFGKGLVRPGGTNYPLKPEVVDEIVKIFDDSGHRYHDIADRIYTLPTVLARFDGIGEVTAKQAYDIGSVGMAARSSGLKRDIRHSHPFQYYRHYNVEPVILDSGDVLARGMIRNLEVFESIKIIRQLIHILNEMPATEECPPVYNAKLKPDTFSISIVEAWRGELCHCAVTDETGNLKHYKVKDPSMHNWMALALAVRNQEISDFPVCNKSFNLSYCGYDL